MRARAATGLTERAASNPPLPSARERTNGLLLERQWEQVNRKWGAVADDRLMLWSRHSSVGTRHCLCSPQSRQRAGSFPARRAREKKGVRKGDQPRKSKPADQRRMLARATGGWKRRAAFLLPVLRSSWTLGNLGLRPIQYSKSRENWICRAFRACVGWPKPDKG